MIIFGKQTSLFVARNHSDLIEEIYFSKEIDKRLFSEFRRLNKPILRLDFKKAQALAKGGNTQGILLKLKNEIPPMNVKLALNRAKKVLVLVGISDVGNIGSIFRSAVGLGIDCIICAKFNQSGVARASSGALFSMPFCEVSDFLGLINELKQSDFMLLGSSLDGRDVSEFRMESNRKWALFLGSENEGIPKRLLKKMDDNLCIKLYNFDSLNVSVAAGILIYCLRNGK